MVLLAETISDELIPPSIPFRQERRRGPQTHIHILQNGDLIKYQDTKKLHYNQHTETTVYGGRWYGVGATELVAIKEIPLDKTNAKKREKVLATAYREFILASILSEAGLGPTVRGIVREEDSILLVSDYMSGGDLVLIDHTFSYGEVLHVAERVLQGLDLLHDPHPGSAYYQTLVELFGDASGRPKIRHADVKLDNLFKDATGEVFVADVGIADRERTSGYNFTGTLVYYAPEYLWGAISAEERPVGRSADLYALGCVLWQLLTRVSRNSLLEMRHIRGASAMVKYARYLNGPDHLDDVMSILYSVRPDIPESLAQIIRICHVPNPEDRFIAAFQMLEAVRDVQKELEGEATHGI